MDGGMIAKIRAGPVGVDFARPEEETRRVKKAEAIGESYMKVARIYTCIHAFRCCCCFCCCCCYDIHVGNPHPSVHPSACARV